MVEVNSPEDEKELLMMGSSRLIHFNSLVSWCSFSGWDRLWETGMV